MNNKTVIVAPAIKVHFWKEIYKALSSGSIPFHIVFVGHIAPSFKLPPNFTHIHCTMNPAACVEIAFRYAYKNIPDARYIVNISDDLKIESDFLEGLVQFYNKQLKEQDTDLLLIGPICVQVSGEENLMATHENGPTLLAPAFTTIENSKKIGGVDKNFQAIYWDCDRHLRTQLLGGKVIFARPDEVRPISEIEQNPGLYYRHKNHDRVLLDNIWNYETSPDAPLISCASLCLEDKEYEVRFGRKRNQLKLNPITLTRTEPVVEYSEKEIGSYYE